MGLKQNIKATTLVETILYLGLFAIIFIVIIQFAFTIGDATDRASAQNELQRNLIFINEHLEETIRSSVAVDDTNTTFSDPDGTLRLTRESGYLEYTVNNGVLTLSDGTNTYDLSSPRLNLSQFQIERIDNRDGSIGGVQVTFVINSNKKNVSRTIQSNYLTVE